MAESVHRILNGEEYFPRKAETELLEREALAQARG